MSRWPLEGRWRTAGIDRTQLAWHAGGVLRTAPRADGVGEVRRSTGARRLRLVAGNDVAVHWLQRPPAVRSLAELQQVAAIRCAQLHGGQPGDWWVAGDWDAGAAFVCAALPRAFVGEVEAQAAAAGVRLRWTTGWAAMRDAMPFRLQAGWNAVRTPGQALLWHSTGDRVGCVAALNFPAGDAPHDDALARHMVLECARQAEVAPGTIRCHQPPAEHYASEAGAALFLGAAG